MKKRMLAGLLAVCMVIAMLPATVFAANNTYTDVPSDAWYADEVDCVTERGLMTHTGDNAFEPGTYTTRGMLMTILARMDGVDTAGTPWYKAGMEWAVAKGVSDGTNPTGLITREQIVTMLYRYENNPYGGASLTGFVDADDVSDWAQAAVEWAVYVGLLEGKDGGRLDPTGTATRAELAAILCRHAHLNEGGGGGGHSHKYIWDETREGCEITENGHYLVCKTNHKTPKTKFEAHSFENIEVECGVVYGTCSVCKYEAELGSYEELRVELENGFGGILNMLTDETLDALTSAFENGTLEEVLPDEHVDENGDGLCDICVKFYLGVTAGETADVTVYDDYSFLINLPCGDLIPGTVTLTAKMQNVASLGGGVKSHTITVNTGLTGSPSLYDYLNSGFQALEGSIVANITDDGATKSVTYTISGNGDGNRKDVVITGTADEDLARAAWMHMTENVDTSTQEADDSYILINGGSYLQLGGEILVFEDGVDELKLDNFNSLSALKQSIKDAVTLKSAEDDTIVAVLTAGTELAVGSSIATLNEDVTVTVSGVEVEEGVLSDIRALAQADEDMAMAKKLMSILDAVLASAVENGTVKVDMVFTEPVEEPEEEEVYEKFYLGVTAGETADVTVYSDYSAVINLPAGDLTPGTVTLTAEMNNVASLGVTGTKSHTVTVNTGLTGSPSLYDYLNSGFQALEGTVVANITDDGETKTVEYTLVGDGDGSRKDVVITGTADEAEARAAWMHMTENVDTTTQDADDSYILINGGSYLQLGGEVLVFEDGVDSLKLDNFNSLSALKQSIKDAVTLDVAEDDAIVAVLTAGTELAVGSSIATLNEDVTVTVSGVEVEEGVLSDIRALAQADEDMAMAKKLMSILDAVLASAVENGTVTVDIEFAEVAVEEPEEEEVYEKFYLGVTAGETADVTVYSDYSAVINLPCGDLTPGTVTLTAAMNNVASLGVTGTKSHTVTVNTGLNGSPSLYDYLNSAFRFTEGTIIANITDSTGTKSVTYALEGTAEFEGESPVRKDVVITATADTEDARAAWQLLTSHVETTTQNADDSYILINGGSYLQVGGEALVFEADVDELKLDNFNSLSALKQSIKDAVTIDEDADDTFEIVLTAGTELAVGSSIATLTQDVTITIYGVEVEDGVLSQIRALAQADEDMAMAKKLVGILDAVLASAVDNGTVEVDIVFGTAC